MKKGMFFGLLVIAAVGFAVMVSGCERQKAAGPDVWSQEDGIFSYKAGLFDVFVLVEGQREGNTGILLGADEELLEQYIPESGFKHSTNAVFIRTGENNVLIDTGTGRLGEPVFDKIKKLGVEPEQIDTVLLTHLHGDHFGGLIKDGEAAFPNAKVYLSEREYDYFITELANEGATAALALYDVELFDPGEGLQAVIPGIFPIAAYGHTPGHTIFQVENGGVKILVWGDLMHLALVQFPVPEISATFDVDPAAAAVTRRLVMDYAAKNDILVAGMHIVYPGIGKVEEDGTGFKFVPVE